jgi:hypothetical protein
MNSRADPAHALDDGIPALWARLRQETTLSVKEIAGRLDLGKSEPRPACLFAGSTRYLMNEQHLGTFLMV